MKKPKRINAHELAKLHATVFGFVGLITGLIYGVGGAVIDTMVSIEWLSSDKTPGLSSGTVLALLAIPIMPILAGAAGYALGIVEACIFNLCSKYLGTFRPKLDKIIA